MEELISFHVSEHRRTLVGVNVSDVPSQKPVLFGIMVLTPENVPVMESKSLTPFQWKDSGPSVGHLTCFSKTMKSFF